MKMRFLAFTLAVAAALTVAGVLAAVQTDKPDYAPGSVVTISGDNSNGAGYLAGETVHVDVSGPNGYAASCEAVADESGAWSCQITLWDSELAVGDYTYTATGLESGVSESGTFTDAHTLTVALAGTGTGRVTADGLYCTNVIDDSASDCFQDYGTGPPPSKTLSATAGTGSAFAGWSGTPCSGTTNPLTVTISGEKTCTATFNLAATSTPVPPTATNTAVPPTATNTAVPPTATATNTAVPPTATPTNAPPSVAAHNASVTVNEGQTAANTGTWSDANAGDTVTLSASVGTVIKSGTNAAGTWSWSFATTDGPNQSQTVTITANDGNGGSNVATFSLTVDNVKPSIAISGASNGDEGSPYSLTLGAVTDPGTDTVTSYIVHWGDGFSNTYVSNGVKTHTYADGPNSYAIIVDLVDEDGTHLDRANALPVTVDNVAPTADAAGPYDCDEGVACPVGPGSGSDVPADTLSYAWDCDNDGIIFEISGQSATCPAFPDGPATPSIGFQVCDEDGGCGTDTATVNVQNVAPTVSLTGDDDAIVGQTKTYSYITSDPGDEVFTRTESCGANAVLLSGSTFSSTTGAGSFDCTFGPAISTVSVTVCDDDGGCGSDSIDVTAIYNFFGFFSPVDMPPVVNLAKAGSTIPLKWRLTDFAGTYVTDVATVVSIMSTKMNCEDGGLTDEIETIATGGTVLRYDFTANQFIYNWWTLKMWAGTCRTLTLTLNDGTKHAALFRFK